MTCCCKNGQLSVKQTGAEPIGGFMQKFILMVDIAHSMITVLLNDQFFGFTCQTVNFVGM